MVRFVAALILFAPAMVSAQEPEREVYKKFTTGWTVIKEDDHCLATRLYEGGDRLIVAYEPAQDRALLSISDPDSTSLREGSKVELHVIFAGKRTLDEEWGSTGFNVYKNGETSQMIGVFDGRDLIRDLARYDLIAFSIDGSTERLVGSYSLDGSAAAMDALRRCSFEAAGLNINDPFLR